MFTEKTNQYIVNGLALYRSGRIWHIPALRNTGNGILEPSSVEFLVLDKFYHLDRRKLLLQYHGPLMGWNKLDSNYSYKLGDYIIPNFVLEKVAEQSGIKLRDILDHES